MLDKSVDTAGKISERGTLTQAGDQAGNRPGDKLDFPGDTTADSPGEIPGDTQLDSPGDTAGDTPEN